jgi:DNA modification methylase
MAEKMINTIICGDCLEVMRDMPDNSVDLVLTDIPYGEVNRAGNGLRSLNKADADVCNFDIYPMSHSLARITEGSIYVFCGVNQISGIRKSLVNCGYSTRNGFWWKTNPSPMNGQHIWLSAIENCVFGKHNQATFNRHCEPPVWRYPSGTSKVHPTQKPLSLMEYLIESSSNEGDLIFDPFCGSGTTCVAAKRLGRRYIGIDISPEYCEIARKRLEAEEQGITVKELEKGQGALFG